MDKNYIEKYELIDGYAIVDNDFSIITANESMYKYIGVSTKYSIIDIIHQVDIDDFINVANGLRMEQSKSIVIRMKRVDNSYRWVHVNIKRSCINDREENEFLELKVSDIAALKKHNEALQKTIIAFRHIMAMDNEMFYAYDYESDLLSIYTFVDNEISVISERSLNETYDYFIEKGIIAQESAQEFEKTIEDIREAKISYNHQFKAMYNFDINSGYVDVKLKGSTIYTEKKPLSSVGSFKSLGLPFDAKHTYDYNNAYKSLSIKDMESYCFNNLKFNPKTKLALILISIDNIEDYRKEKGEEAASNIKNITCDIITKVTEFRGVYSELPDSNRIVIIVKNMDNEKDLRAFLEYLRTRISWSCKLFDPDYNIKFSIGISRYPENGTDWAVIKDKLIKAMELANIKGGNRFIIYKEYLHDALFENNKVDN
ncbi:MAG: hypothetical protein ACI4E1_04815 [Lachnospira sp.]